jgi:c-di-GMP-binding flagellar brake protein YcgR
MTVPDIINPKQETSIPGSTLEAHQPNYVLICEPEQVTQILQQLLQMQTRLAIQLATPEGVQTTQTTVLRIDPKPTPGQVILHQPEHASWYRLLQEKPYARISCYLPNGRLTFSTRVAPLETIVEGSFFCRCPVPEAIRKYQQRSSYRLPVPPGSCMVMLVHANNRVDGECLDFSISGCCLLLHDNPGKPLEKNSEINNLMINLGGVVALTVSVKVRRIVTTESGKTVVGAQYLDLTPQQQNQLQAALTQIQRQQLRKKIRLS